MKAAFLAFLAVLIYACKPDSKAPVDKFSHITGEVIGTYYSIKYKGEKDIKHELGQLYEKLNASLSTYVPSSTISLFNQAKDSLVIQIDIDKHFLPVWLRAKTIYKWSEGAFDPTVGPLVNFYGFGYTEKKQVEKPSKKTINQLLDKVGFNKMNLVKSNNSITIYKEVEDSELDFSAIAKGYYVDEVGRFLISKGIEHFLVDIGGESIAKGSNPQGHLWGVGINKPDAESTYTELELAIGLDNAGVASSGNYRNFYVNEIGEKYVHTIDPKTGLTKQSTLLSATIVASDCMTADALATTCMVMGLPKALTFIEDLEGIEACFISGNKDKLVTQFTSGFNRMVLDI